MSIDQAATGFVQLLPVIGMSALAYAKPHPVFLMFTGGVSMITALYMADIINGGVTTNLTVTVSLGVICYALVSIAFAFAKLFMEKEQ